MAESSGSGNNKRKAEELEGAIVVKKQRTDAGALITTTSDEQPKSVRTSDLQAPIMLLTGHEAAINALSFSPDGKYLASASADKTILLWEVFGECKNYGVLRGHKNQVLEVQWGKDVNYLFSAGADQCGAIWDLERNKRVKRLGEHTATVHSISAGTNASSRTCVTVSDDGTAKLWDVRSKSSVMTLPHQYPLTAVAFDNRTNEGEGFLYCGGIDNLVHCWDTRKINQTMFKLMGHRDTITSLRIDPYGSYVLSNAMDHELRVWDIRPFAPMQRCVKVFVGAQHNFEKHLIKANWAPDGSLVGAGSADRMVYVWDTTSREIRYRLPGHEGTVTETAFHPKQPIVASCGTDKRIYLGEIQKYGTVVV